MARKFYKRRNFPLASVKFSFALFLECCGTKENCGVRKSFIIHRKKSFEESFFAIIIFSDLFGLGYCSIYAFI